MHAHKTGWVISIFSKHNNFQFNFLLKYNSFRKEFFPLQILQISFLIKHLPASLYFELLGLRTNTLILIGLTVFYRMQLDCTFWILHAATSGSRVGAPRVWASLSRSSCSRISFMNLALSRPCRARSWTWIILMASSSDILSSSFCCQNIS